MHLKGPFHQSHGNPNLNPIWIERLIMTICEVLGSTGEFEVIIFIVSIREVTDVWKWRSVTNESS